MTLVVGGMIYAFATWMTLPRAGGD